MSYDDDDYLTDKGFNHLAENVLLKVIKVREETDESTNLFLLQIMHYRYQF